MLLLAVDTSGKNGSLALAREHAGQLEILELVPLVGGTFSAQLVPQIVALLSRHGFSKQDISGFAVASGPGSFTGLRVGLAAIKGLAEILRKPIAAVSLLEAVARSGTAQGKTLAALDGGRGEVYAGEYEMGATGARMISERLLTRSEFLATAPGRAVVTPDPSIAEAARGGKLRVAEIAYPRSDRIAQLGWEKIRAGETVSPEQLEANYIRRPDAKIFSKANS
jgi:tRNA threonylcarbamoyladenosine biosynthesis protein TsaB